MGMWSTGFDNCDETNDVEEILEFCLETYHELTLPPTRRRRGGHSIPAPSTTPHYRLSSVSTGAAEAAKQGSLSS